MDCPQRGGCEGTELGLRHDTHTHKQDLETTMSVLIDELPALLTPPELARFMRTTTNTLAQDRYLGRGVPFIKAGRRILYARNDVLAYLERNTIQRTDDPRGAVVA
jgi:hypothetical protein